MITKLVSDGVTTKWASDVNEAAFKIRGRSLAEAIESELLYYDRQLKRCRESIAKNFEAAEKLVNAGLTAGCFYAESIDIELEAEAIPAYVRVLGPFGPGGKDVVDDRDDVILVTLRSKAYPSVLVSYQRAVKPTDKCKVVTETQQPYTRRYVACSI